MLAQRLLLKSLGVTACALGLAFGCAGDMTEEEPVPDVTTIRQAIGEKDILDALEASMPNQEIKVPGASGKDIEKALDDLGKRFKETDPSGKRIKAEDSFYNTLTPKQKRAADRIAEEYKKKVDAGEVTAVRDSSGKLRPEYKGLKMNQGMGRSAGPTSGPPLGTLEDRFLRILHVVGDGWWRWSTSVTWTGVQVSVNHNFTYYLCAYTAWLVERWGLPGWLASPIKTLGCLLHSRDTDSNGCSVTVTWWGSFSTSC